MKKPPREYNVLQKELEGLKAMRNLVERQIADAEAQSKGPYLNLLLAQGSLTEAITAGEKHLEFLLKNPTTQPKFLIWSREHQAYWKAGRNGYTKNADEAGVYSLREGLEICQNAHEWVNLTVHGPEETLLPLPIRKENK
jgi:hypothetical protein